MGYSKNLLSLFFFFASVNAGLGQYTIKEINPFHKAYYDSLKKMDYGYTFPILGKQAYKKGFDIPYAMGISAIYFTQRQEITISSTNIGFNGGPMVDMSKFLQFGPTIATSNVYSVRPDIWLFPFLNLYGIFGVGTTNTDVNIAQPAAFSTSQHFSVSSVGIGATVAGGIGPVWLAWDNNKNWANVDAVAEPVPAFNSSFRVGHTLISPQKVDRSLAIWGGVFYQSLQNDTRGSLKLTDIFPKFGTNQGNLILRLREWEATLPPAQRVVADQIIDKLEDISQGRDPGNATVQYLLDKKVTAPFNLIFGAQYQFNKKWILRTELGVFGKRSQFLLNLNYRFQGFKNRSK